MTAKVINLAAARRERKERAKCTPVTGWPLLDAGLMLNPFALMWLESYDRLGKTGSESVILQFDEPG